MDYLLSIFLHKLSDYNPLFSSIYTYIYIHIKCPIYVRRVHHIIFFLCSCINGNTNVSIGLSFHKEASKMVHNQLTKPPTHSFNRPWSSSWLVLCLHHINLHRSTLSLFSSIALQQHLYAICGYFYVWYHVSCSWQSQLCLLGHLHFLLSSHINLVFQSYILDASGRSSVMHCLHCWFQVITASYWLRQ